MSGPLTKEQRVTRAKTTFLNMRRIFIEDSPLYEYLVRKQPHVISQNLKTHSVAKIIAAIHNVVAVFSLFDAANPFIVHCNSELEVALQVGAFHVCQLAEIVCRQLVPLTRMSFSTLLLPLPLPLWASIHSVAVKVHRQRLAQPLDPLLNYWVHPHLRELLHPFMSHEDQGMLTLPYNTITGLFKQYLESRVDLFFDRRNLDIALLAGTTLEKIFLVKSIYKLQVPDFLRPLLIQFTNARQETWPDFENIYRPLKACTDPQIEAIPIEPITFVDPNATESFINTTFDIKDDPLEDIFIGPNVNFAEFL